MIDGVIVWVLTLVVVASVSAAFGLVLERLAGADLPGELVVASGFCVFIVLADLSTLAGRHTGVVSAAILPLAAVAAVAGGRGWRRPFDRPVWIGAGIGVALLTLPFVVHGAATFGGYGVLGDTAVQMLGAEVLPRTGRAAIALEPSSVSATLDAYFVGAGYPAGPQTALGIIDRTFGFDVLRGYAPFITATVAVVGLAAGSLLDRSRYPSSVRGAVAFVAVAAPLQAAYVWQGSLKEATTAAAVVTAVAAGSWWWRQREAPGFVRAGVLVAVPAAAALSASSVGALPWIGLLALILLAVLAVAVRHGDLGPRTLAMGAVSVAVIVIALATPTVLALRQLLEVAPAVLTAKVELGNLLRPLPAWQTVAPWPTEDFRLDLHGAAKAVGLAGAIAMLAAGALGVRGAVVRRSWGILAWLSAALGAWVAVSVSGSPWAEAKAMVLAASPVFAVACLAAAGAGRRWLLLVPVGVVIVTVPVHAAGVAFGPVGRLEQLRKLDARIGGRGPTLVLEFDEFAKVALRRSSPTVIGDPWQARPVLGQGGQPLGRTAAYGGPIVPGQVARSTFGRYRWAVVPKAAGSTAIPGFRSVTATRDYVLLARTTGTTD
jgi:hypothetical protein